MDVYALVAAMGGEIVRNRARVRVGGEIVVVGEMEDGALTLNEAGRRLVNQATSEVVEPKKPRKPRAAAVESADTHPGEPSAAGGEQQPQ